MYGLHFVSLIGRCIFYLNIFDIVFINLLIEINCFMYQFPLLKKKNFKDLTRGQIQKWSVSVVLSLWHKVKNCNHPHTIGCQAKSSQFCQLEWLSNVFFNSRSNFSLIFENGLVSVRWMNAKRHERKSSVMESVANQLKPVSNLCREQIA